MTLQYTNDDGNSVQISNLTTTFKSDPVLIETNPKYFTLTTSLDTFRVTDDEVQQALSTPKRPAIREEFDNANQLEIVDLPRMQQNARQRSSKAISPSPERVACFKRLNLCNSGSVSTGIHIKIVQPALPGANFFICDGQSSWTTYVKPNKKTRAVVLDARAKLSDLLTELDCVVEPESSKLVIRLIYLFNMIKLCCTYLII